MKLFTEKNYQDILNADRVSFIFFTSENCHLCKELKPIIEKLEDSYKDINFYLCKINEQPKLTKTLLKGEGVPTGFVVKEGKTYKMKDPLEPDDDSWYSKQYLTELIEALT